MAGKRNKSKPKPAPVQHPAPIPVIAPGSGGVNYGDRKRHRTR